MVLVVLGLAVAGLGFGQESLGLVWWAQLLHVLAGVAAIGVAEAIGGRCGGAPGQRHLSRAALRPKQRRHAALRPKQRRHAALRPKQRRRAPLRSKSALPRP